MYEYKGSGLDGIFLKNGFKEVENTYGKGVVIEDIDGLHRAIALDVLSQKTPMTGQQFRFLRKEQDLVQEEAAALFRVNVQTIANWEKLGRAAVPGPSDIAMRAFYAAYIHANFWPVKIEGETDSLEQAVFQLEGEQWVESAPKAA